MPKENRPETAREADLCRQLAQRDQYIKQLQQRLKRRDQPPPPTPRPPGGGFDGGWMGG